MRGMLLKVFSLLVLVLGNIVVLWGQFNQEWAYTYKSFHSYDDEDKDLFLDVVANNFFKNNEYESDFLQGYTLSGYSLQPTLEYYTNPNFRLQGGVNLLKYNGAESFTHVVPIVSAHLILTPNLQLIMGTLKGGVQHEIIEPMYNPERQCSRPAESGAQFLYDSKRLKSDVWVDWEQFISEGDTIPETFVVGMNTSLFLSRQDNAVKFSIPFQFLARHIGGEISNYEDAVQSYVNIASGIKIDADINGGLIKGIKGSAYYLGYKDLQNVGLLGVKSGKGMYADCTLKYKFGEFLSGYFYGDNYIGVLGNGLFNSYVSSREVNAYQKKRSVVLNKFSLVKEFFTDLKFGLSIQSYYDVGNGDFMYSYGFSIVLKNAKNLFGK